MGEGLVVGMGQGMGTWMGVEMGAGMASIPGDIQGQDGWGSEQTDPVEDIPAYCRGLGLDGLQRSLPTQTIG